MEVFVLTFQTYDYTKVLGVYVSEQLANDAARDDEKEACSMRDAPDVGEYVIDQKTVEGLPSASQRDSRVKEIFQNDQQIVRFVKAALKFFGAD